MKGSSSAGVTLAIIAALAVGVVTTWFIMRQPQQVVVVFQGTPPPESTGAPRVFSPGAVSSPSGSSPKPGSSIKPAKPLAPAAVSRAQDSTDEGSVPAPAIASPAPIVQSVAVAYQRVNTFVREGTDRSVLDDQVSPGTRGTRGSPDTIDDALSYALEAADPYLKEGFTIREDYWGGDLPVKSTKTIVHQLFKGNEYWFWVGVAAKNAVISVDVYDSEGNLTEAEAWTQPHFAAARVAPRKTGSHYLIVSVEKSDQERTTWAMAYGFR